MIVAVEGLAGKFIIVYDEHFVTRIAACYLHFQLAVNAIGISPNVITSVTAPFFNVIALGVLRSSTFQLTRR